MYTSEPSPAEAELVDKIVRKASGVFIWGRLVIYQLTKEIIDGTSFVELNSKILQLPSELEDLYRLTVERINREYYSEIWIMFQAVLCALKTL